VSGELNEKPLVDAIERAMFSSVAKSDDGPIDCLGDIIDCQPNRTHLILRAAALAALRVLRDRGLINELGISVLDRDGEK